MSSESMEDTADIYVVGESKNERFYKSFGSEDSTITLKKAEENVSKTLGIAPESVFLGKKQNEIPFNFSQRLSLGGPFSAFSQFGNLDLKLGIAKEASRTFVPNDASFLARSSTSEIPELRFGARPDFPPSFPIPPAFAQIFQRRKRRETRPRRQRTTFTSEQTMKLEIEYNRAEYITRPRRFELADLLDLSENQIKIWFQNRRAKDKRIEKAQMDQQLR
ncbi:hypothetical protein CHS0354_033371 [Potamilus streckersoni]|uniref:Homeobox domain-containing protein n=1 Tax=Potamilus streckersoni TaxID=2493646 RepID=A0AAE0RTI6_9BIVA|nr:hypothetical protein CHS0354_033371 [Potamilus streckersoni]